MKNTECFSHLLAHLLRATIRWPLGATKKKKYSEKNNIVCVLYFRFLPRTQNTFVEWKALERSHTHLQASICLRWLDGRSLTDDDVDARAFVDHQNPTVIESRSPSFSLTHTHAHTLLNIIVDHWSVFWDSWNWPTWMYCIVSEWRRGMPLKPVAYALCFRHSLCYVVSYVSASLSHFRVVPAKIQKEQNSKSWKNYSKKVSLLFLKFLTAVKCPGRRRDFALVYFFSIVISSHWLCLYSFWNLKIPMCLSIDTLSFSLLLLSESERGMVRGDERSKKLLIVQGQIWVAFCVCVVYESHIVGERSRWWLWMVVWIQLLFQEKPFLRHTHRRGESHTRSEDDNAPAPIASNT